MAVCGEAVTRAIEAVRGPTASLYEYIVLRGDRHKMLPLASVRVPERYGTIRYSFNSNGYRDDDPFSGGRNAAIVLLGDSVAFGLGVQQELTFAQRLQQALDQRAAGSYDIVNLAMFGYHSKNELDAFREDGMWLRPHLVIVQFYMNDFSMSAGEVGTSRPSMADRLRAARNRTLYSSALYRRVHQAFAGLSYLTLHDLRRRYPQSLNHAEPEHKLAYLAERPDGEVPAFDALRKIHELSAGIGARMLLVVSPDEVQLYEHRYDAINQRIARFCTSEGVPYLDLLPIFRTSAEPVELFLDGVHLSDRGHALAAETLEPVLVEMLTIGRERSPAEP